jgi:nucleoside phosphorylase
VETLLLVAAERFEFRGFARVLSGAEVLPWPLGFARSAMVNGRRWLMVADGAGARLAAQAAEYAAGRARVDKVVSTGFCGALDKALGVGEVFVATRVMREDGSPVCDAADPRACRPHRAGPLVSVDRVAASVSERRALFERGAAAVEMEAAGVGEWALKRGCPFYCVRAVTDTADQSFSIDFDGTRDAEGRFRASKVCLAAMRRPWKSVPELMGLAWRGRRCSRVLGEFLADCAF